VNDGNTRTGFETTHLATRQRHSTAGVEGPEGVAAVPVGGGRARAGLEIDHWGGRPRGGAAAHRHTQRPGPTKQPGPAGGQDTR